MQGRPFDEGFLHFGRLIIKSRAVLSAEYEVIDLAHFIESHSHLDAFVR